MNITAVINTYPITTSIVVLFLILYFFSLYSYFTQPQRTSLYAADGSKVTDRYPPILEVCPPYWSTLPSGECKKDFDNGAVSCDAREISQNLMYNEKNPIVNLNDLNWVQRCKWAKKCGVKYDFNKPCIQDAFEGYEQV